MLQMPALPMFEAYFFTIYRTIFTIYLILVKDMLKYSKKINTLKWIKRK